MAGRAKLDANTLSEIAKIFGHPERASLLLALLEVDEDSGVSADEVWSSVSPQNRWALLRPLRPFLEIGRASRREPSTYRLREPHRQFVEEIMTALTNLSESASDRSIRISVDLDGLWTIRSPEGVLRVERSEVLRSLSQSIENLASLNGEE